MINYIYEARKKKYKDFMDFKSIEQKSSDLINYDMGTFTLTYMIEMQQNKEDIEKKFIIFLLSLKNHQGIF